ncbi:DUF6343 family protein [Catenulispora subtropica]|uniref:DUF3099 domain-containing protein n=1 Tax=Catenulispora subtropica TaxID=450798 RepID=A0ABN2RJM2_9ACTN
MTRYDPHRIRSGDEPMHARSPLRMRLTMALIGLASAIGGIVFFLTQHATGFVIACAVIGALALIDVVIVARHIRQGPHWQPGRDIPPYRPVEEPEDWQTSRAPLSRRTREQVYLAMMGTCLVLVILAWTVVRLFSPGLAVGMSVVAAFIPPFAVMVANSRGRNW